MNDPCPSTQWVPLILPSTYDFISGTSPKYDPFWTDLTTYFNDTISVSAGEEYYCGEYVYTFLTTPWWVEYEINIEETKDDKIANLTMVLDPYTTLDEPFLDILYILVEIPAFEKKTTLEFP